MANSKTTLSHRYYTLIVSMIKQLYCKQSLNHMHHGVYEFYKPSCSAQQLTLSLHLCAAAWGLRVYKICRLHGAIVCLDICHKIGLTFTFKMSDIVMAVHQDSWWRVERPRRSIHMSLQIYICDHYSELFTQMAALKYCN